MDEFLSRYFIMIVSVVFLVLFVGRILMLMWRTRKIENEGVEVDAVISRIGYEEDPDDGDSYYVYANYIDETGEQRESVAGIYSVSGYDEGENVRIRFLPGEYDRVRIV